MTLAGVGQALPNKKSMNTGGAIVGAPPAPTPEKSFPHITPGHPTTGVQKIGHMLGVVNQTNFIAMPNIAIQLNSRTTIPKTKLQELQYMLTCLAQILRNMQRVHTTKPFQRKDFETIFADATNKIMHVTRGGISEQEAISIAAGGMNDGKGTGISQVATRGQLALFDQSDIGVQFFLPTLADDEAYGCYIPVLPLNTPMNVSRSIGDAVSNTPFARAIQTRAQRLRHQSSVRESIRLGPSGLPGTDSCGGYIGELQLAIDKMSRGISRENMRKLTAKLNQTSKVKYLDMDTASRPDDGRGGRTFRFFSAKSIHASRSIRIFAMEVYNQALHYCHAPSGMVWHRQLKKQLITIPGVRENISKRVIGACYRLGLYAVINYRGSRRMAKDFLGLSRQKLAMYLCVGALLRTDQGKELKSRSSIANCRWMHAIHWMLRYAPVFPHSHGEYKEVYSCLLNAHDGVLEESVAATVSLGHQMFKRTNADYHRSIESPVPRMHGEEREDYLEQSPFWWYTELLEEFDITTEIMDHQRLMAALQEPAVFPFASVTEDEESERGSSGSENGEGLDVEDKEESEEGDEPGEEDQNFEQAEEARAAQEEASENEPDEEGTGPAGDFEEFPEYFDREEQERRREQEEENDAMLREARARGEGQEEKQRQKDEAHKRRVQERKDFQDLCFLFDMNMHAMLATPEDLRINMTEQLVVTLACTQNGSIVPTSSPLKCHIYHGDMMHHTGFMFYSMGESACTIHTYRLRQGVNTEERWLQLLHGIGGAFIKTFDSAMSPGNVKICDFETFSALGMALNEAACQLNALANGSLSLMSVAGDDAYNMMVPYSSSYFVQVPIVRDLNVSQHPGRAHGREHSKLRFESLLTGLRGVSTKNWSISMLGLPGHYKKPKEGSAHVSFSLKSPRTFLTSLELLGMSTPVKIPANLFPLSVNAVLCQHPIRGYSVVLAPRGESVSKYYGSPRFVQPTRPYVKAFRGVSESMPQNWPTIFRITCNWSTVDSLWSQGIDIGKFHYAVNFRLRSLNSDGALAGTPMSYGFSRDLFFEDKRVFSRKSQENYLFKKSQGTEGTQHLGLEKPVARDYWHDAHVQPSIERQSMSNYNSRRRESLTTWWSQVLAGEEYVVPDTSRIAVGINEWGQFQRGSQGRDWKDALETLQNMSRMGTRPIPDSETRQSWRTTKCRTTGYYASLDFIRTTALDRDEGAMLLGQMLTLADDQTRIRKELMNGSDGSGNRNLPDQLARMGLQHEARVRTGNI